MTQTCSKCSRVNPAEASYCYYDGSVLGGHGHRVNGGPINTGTQPFHNQFVFPTGQVCRNFDELCLACQEHWPAAVDLLQQGYLETFLGGLGRADLAMAAREAARFPDRDRGLDQLLAKLPSQVVAPPKLDVAPREVSLGQVNVGDDRDFELHLTNQGMRLLYGTVNCEDCVWLTVGEAPGAPQKLFQFDSELLIPVHVRGKRLRAGNKPLEGRLTIESNGGVETVTVRAEVPVKPYPDGMFAGARTPRQVAEKAKPNPKEAAVLFEKGAVARWYESNGWTYPVQGPSASGVGAVQQFFEALGLTAPPKVEVNPRSLSLQGNVGDPLRGSVAVSTQEKRPVYAHGTSDQSWLEVGRAQLDGRIATIPLVVPAVPNRAGEKLQAKVTIRANGNQRFVIPVNLEVGGDFNFGADQPVVGTVNIVEAPAPGPLSPGKEAVVAEAPPEKKPAARVRRSGPGLDRNNLIHAVPAGVLALALLIVLVIDLVLPPKHRGTDEGLGGDRTGFANLLDKTPRIAVKWTTDPDKFKGRFGIVMTQEKDPANPDRPKRLTFDEQGNTNNTCLRVDGKESLLGVRTATSKWYRDKKGTTWTLVDKDGVWTSKWEFQDEKVLITQEVQVVPGEQTHLLDTCLVHYTIENQDDKPHEVGIRVMLDTFIGANDGVPFLIPGQSAMVQTLQPFGQKEIPDFIRAQERSDPKDPGTVAQLGFKLQGVEPLEKMVICRWPGNSEIRWDWDYKPMNEPKDEKPDSCVVLYWAEQKMEAGEKREMAFTYGLGTVSGASGRLGVFATGNTQPNGVFTVTAYVKDPQEGQRITLHLPPEFKLADNETEEKTITQVEKGKDGQVSWRVRASKEGEFEVEVRSGLDQQKGKVTINNKSIFG